MPVVKIENISDDSCWGLWKIEETTESLIDQSLLSGEEQKELKKISNIKRKKEWLSARVLLKHIVNNYLFMDYLGTFKDANSKPFLFGHTEHISISHSFPYAVTILNRNKPCGIDIEKPKPALFHVAPKFLDEVELRDIKHKPHDLCLAWAAKEVLFKIHGKQRLSFKENLHLDTDSFKNKECKITAEISVSELYEKHSLVYETIENHIICFSI